jgi:hypothetical protein
MRTKNPPDLSSALNMPTNDFQFDVDKKPSFLSNVHRSPPGQRPPKPFYRELYTNNYPKNNSSRQIVPVGYYKPTPMSVSTRMEFQPDFFQIHPHECVY